MSSRKESVRCKIHLADSFLITGVRALLNHHLFPIMDIDSSWQLDSTPLAHGRGVLGQAKRHSRARGEAGVGGEALLYHCFTSIIDIYTSLRRPALELPPINRVPTIVDNFERSVNFFNSVNFVFLSAEVQHKLLD